MLFYKQIDKVNKYKIFHKEIFSLKTNKKDGQCFSQTFEYKSPSLKTKEINLISFYMNENNNNISCSIELRNYNKIYFTLIQIFLEKTGSPIITFEITVEYKTLINEMLTSIEYNLDNHIDYNVTNCKLLKVFIETTDDFSFNCLNNDLHLKKLKKISPNEIQLEGLPYYFSFNFILNNYKLPRTNTNCFYC